MGGRTGVWLTACLALAVLAFALVADGALRGRARAAEAERAVERGRQAELAAGSVRAAVARLEQDVAAGRPGALVDVWSLPAPPLALLDGRDPIAGGAADALREMLASNLSTRAGLPAAVVAALALGTETARRQAAEALLEGRLPVTAADLPVAAGWLGARDDPRVATLAERLRAVPTDLPVLPTFARSLEDDGRRLVGWAREPAGRRLRYSAPAAILLARAGLQGPVRRVEPGSPGAAVVADVPGLALVAPERGLTRARALAPRLGLWLVTASLLVAAGLGRRAAAREAAAVARERSFLASVTHELRTPLTAVRLLGQTLADGRGEPREYGRLVAAESDRLEQLVDRVLASARAVEAPRVALADAAAIAREASALVASRARGRRVGICLRGADEPVPVAWDADGVRRALLNLLDNAVRHGPADATVTLDVAAGPATVTLAVRDEGGGPRLRDRRRIFGRFERGGSDAPGTGLGLWLAEGVARAHGGRVDLDVEGGLGCTFSLVLPRRPRRTVPEAALRAASPEAGGVGSAGEVGT